MSEEWGVKPPGLWGSVDIDEVAKRFNVLPFTVRRMMKEIEVSRRQELEQKIDLRLNRASEFLRMAYDKEAAMATCKACGQVGFDTWDEMQAHVRCHLLMDFLDDPKGAGVAQRCAADIDKLMYPQHKISMRQKRMGVLPPDEDAHELEARVVGKLGSGS